MADISLKHAQMDNIRVTVNSRVDISAVQFISLLTMAVSILSEHTGTDKLDRPSMSHQGHFTLTAILLFTAHDCPPVRDSPSSLCHLIAIVKPT